MNRNQPLLLYDMLTELLDIEAFTEDGEAYFQHDTKTQKAVIRCYEVIGEAVKRLPEEFRESYEQVDWRQLANFRDFLAHNYDMVVYAYVWDAVVDAPRLREEIEKLVAILEALDKDTHS